MAHQLSDAILVNAMALFDQVVPDMGTVIGFPRLLMDHANSRAQHARLNGPSTLQAETTARSSPPPRRQRHGISSRWDRDGRSPGSLSISLGLLCEERHRTFQKVPLLFQCGISSHQPHKLFLFRAQQLTCVALRFILALLNLPAAQQMVGDSKVLGYLSNKPCRVVH